MHASERRRHMVKSSSRRALLRRNRQRAILCVCLLGLAFLAGCATPIQVDRISGYAARNPDVNVISTGELSESTLIVLRRDNLSDRLAFDPDGTIALLHQTIANRPGDADTLFALAELSYRRALDTGTPSYYRGAAVYAYAFLFPDNPKWRPSAFDPRFRTACVIYNRGLALSFATADGTKVDLRSGTFGLPVGTIDIAFDPSSARWGNIPLSDFVPADSLSVSGLEALYRRPGIGASLAAEAAPGPPQEGIQIEPNVRVPVTALLRIDAPDRNLARGNLKGRVEVHPAFEPSDVMIAGQSVPLEEDTSKAFALSLTDPKVWESESQGFLDGSLFDRANAQLTALEPYRSGQIPVVFIHGTGSSSARWANLINDLQSDPVIRTKFQFWSFTYATGSDRVFRRAAARGAWRHRSQARPPRSRSRVARHRPHRPQPRGAGGEMARDRQRAAPLGRAEPQTTGRAADIARKRPPATRDVFRDADAGCAACYFHRDATARQLCCREHDRTAVGTAGHPPGPLAAGPARADRP
jgi:hypothetical protein